MIQLFKEVMIWKSIDGASAVRYSCLNDLTTGKFAVQSADFFRLPLNLNSSNEFARQFAELFIETSPLVRCTWFDSLEEAVFHHDREFSRGE